MLLGKTGDLQTKLIQHKHKFICRRDMQKSLDENYKGEYVVLDCVCKKCEMSDKAISYHVLELTKVFDGGYETLEIFLSQPMNGYAEETTRNNKEFWDRLIEMGKRDEGQHLKTDIRCHNCETLFSHKQTGWKPRANTFDINLDYPGVPKNVKRDMEESMKIMTSNLPERDKRTSPNKIFGVSEYEYRGFCPFCNKEQFVFWFGEKSIKRNKNVSMEQRPFYCNKCENEINRELQTWYSLTNQEEEIVKEYLVMMCPKCNTEQGYPFEYDLERGIIE